MLLLTSWLIPENKEEISCIFLVGKCKQGEDWECGIERCRKRELVLCHLYFFELESMERVVAAYDEFVGEEVEFELGSIDEGW